MKNRSELREVIIKVLYSTYILDDINSNYDLKELIKEHLEVENDFVEDTCKGIIKDQNNINKLANKYLKESNWTIDRLSKVDKAIINLGIYELISTDTPPIVAINEAVELSKKYSDAKVTSMINAVLDNVYHNEVEINE
jgi:N utilization substance protein B